MDKSIEIQRQVRNNASDFHAYAKELNDWEAEMKQKDKFLQQPNDNQDLPPVRSKKPREPKEQKVVVQKHKAQTYSCDYSNWDKFDADEACKDVDKSTSEESEDEGDIIAESASRAEQAKQKARLAAKEKADKEKVKGNDYVKKEKWDDAIYCYTRAINLFNEDAVYYANRGLCHLKKESWFDAEVDCTASLKLNPVYVKALQRRGTAYAAQAKLVEAIADLSKVVKIEPKNTQAKKQIEELQKKIMKTKTKDEYKGIDKNESLISNGIQQKTSSQSKDIKELNETMQLVDKILSDDDTTDLTNWSTGCCGDGTVLVYPIRKPPHLRSKKPLRRIEIQEIISQDIKRKSTHTIVHNPSTSRSESFVAQSEIENITSIPYKDNKLYDIDSKDKKDLINNIKIEEIKTEQLYESHKADPTSINDLEDIEYKMPITSVQFYNEWDLFKNNPVKRFQLLKSIPATNLGNFFGISMEPIVLSEILNLLNDKFVISRLPIWNYLQGIAQIPRFYSLRMFMSAVDIEVIKNLFEYCKTNSEAADEEFKYLQERYELN